MTHLASLPRHAAPAGLLLGFLVLGLSACTTTERQQIVREPARCADQTVQVYFEAQSWELTREGRAVIDEAARRTKGCKVTSVEVLGLADAAGGPAAGMELSQKRAGSVAAALRADSLPAADYKVAAAGQAGAVTPEGKTQPMRRRADIVLHLAAQ